MDLSGLVPYLLFLHVLGAIIAFGPTFSFAIIGAMGGKEPQHANFATRVSARISDRVVEPLAVVQGVTGVLLIISAGLDLFASRWLLLGIVLYVIALTFALTLQRTTVNKVVAMTSAPPPPGASGPPPGLPELVKKVQRGGMFLGLMIIAIVFLMVVKPSL